MQRDYLRREGPVPPILVGLGEVWRSRGLLGALIRRQLAIRASRSTIGAIWPALGPVFLLLLYTYVFQRVVEVPVHNYPVFLFSALLPWSLLALTAPLAVTSISGEVELVRRSPFPYLLLPMATCGAMGVYTLATLAGFLAYLAVTSQLAYSLVPILVVPLLALFLFVSALAILLSIIDIYSRWLRFILGNLITIWFFLVPIVYRPNMVSGPARWLRSIDPMNIIVGQFRSVLYFQHIADPAHLVIVLVLSGMAFVAAVMVAGAVSQQIPKEIG